jgi:hypothetical protein
MASLKERVPWWLKICAKLVLARMPIPYHRWRSVFIELYGLSYVLVQIGILPEFMFVPIFNQGEAIETRSPMLDTALVILP